MIYYFSGTGNSLFVAKSLSQSLQLSLVDMADAQQTTLQTEGEMVGFVLPTYAWGVPRIVSEFLEKWQPKSKPHYVFAVFTCGDDMGYADHVLRCLLQRIELFLHAVFSVQMRETYICLPGFDVDTDDKEREKHLQAELRVNHIAECVKNFTPQNEQELHRGSFPWLKTYVVRPLFNALLINDKHFHVDKTMCIRCQKCVKLCPLHNITSSSEQLPQWNGHCTHCLRCYHACPKHAIGYGFFTRHKGQVKINV